MTPVCVVCGDRASRYVVPVFQSFGPRQHLRDEDWCSECHDEIVARQPGEFIWRHATDGWLRRPSPKARGLLSWFDKP